jgi:hypothetical protein
VTLAQFLCLDYLGQHLRGKLQNIMNPVLIGIEPGHIRDAIRRGPGGKE